MTDVSNQLEAVKQSLTQFIEPEMSLPRILDLMTMVDEGVVEASAAEMTALMDRAGHKVDSYKFVDEQFGMDELRLANRIKEFQAAKKTITNKRENLKKLLVYAMQKNGFTKFKGEDYKVALRTSKSINPKREPVAMDVVIAPECVKVTYEWKKTELKAALAKGDQFAAAVCEIKESVSPTFSVNKGIADD